MKFEKILEIKRFDNRLMLQCPLCGYNEIFYEINFEKKEIVCVCGHCKLEFVLKGK